MKYISNYQKNKAINILQSILVLLYFPQLISNYVFCGQTQNRTLVLVSNKYKFVDKKAVVMSIRKLSGKNQQFIGVQLQTLMTSILVPLKANNTLKLNKIMVCLLNIKLSNQWMELLYPIFQLQIQTEPQLQKLMQLKIQHLNKKQAIQQQESLKKLQLEIKKRHKINCLTNSNKSNWLSKLKVLKKNFKKLSRKSRLTKKKSLIQKKIQRLQEQLEASQGNLQEFQKLTIKMQNLLAKNVKMRKQIQAAKTEARNNQILKPSQKQGGKDSSKFQQFEQNIKILNQKISLLQGDLNEERQRVIELYKQLERLKAKSGDVTKLEKKLKSRDDQLEPLKAELQASADAVSFTQKLTLDMLKKQESLKQSISKLTETLEVQISEQTEMIELQFQQLQTQQEEIPKVMNQKQQGRNHIAELNRQIVKYKNKIKNLAQKIQICQ